VRKLVPIMAASLLIAGGIQARTWNVNPLGTGDAPTVQAAVDSAASGDFIILAAGTYREGDILVDGKDITIGQSGKAVLSAPLLGAGVGITLRSVSSAGSLMSLTFIGYHTAVSLENSSASVMFLTIKQCINGVVVTFGTGAPSVLGCLADSCDVGVDVQGETVRLQNSTIVFCTTGVRTTGGSATITRNIIYSCDVGAECAGAPGTYSCNDFYLNTTNYNGCSAGATDFYSDPIFCFQTPPSPGLFYLHNTSPCLTAINSCGQTVGAFTSGPGCSGTPVEGMTWGKIKSLYR
jgi:hypothetical protein